MIKKIIKAIVGKRIIHFIEAHLLSHNLDKLAQIYGTDKYDRHKYTGIYKNHFLKFRRKKIKLLEIGVGGYDNPTQGGASLRMWKRFFPNTRIFAIDIFNKSALQENRIQIFQGSQADPDFLNEVNNNTGPFDIIIDDGSHMNEHVIISFKTLFPLLKKGGIYVVEDIQTSYLEEYGGNGQLQSASGTSMNFFKGLTDHINRNDIPVSQFFPSEEVYSIASIHFYPRIIFIYKANDPA
jgi:hypothetical protein